MLLRCGNADKTRLWGQVISDIIKPFATGVPAIMRITADTVRAERARIKEDADRYARLINDTRASLAVHFETEVGDVEGTQFEDAVDEVFADGDRAVNVAALCRLLREVDVAEDYPGFVVDEFLGRRLAATIAGGEPLRTLAEATFHFADVHIDDPSRGAGRDDLDAAIVAGFQTVLPGWPWRRSASPYGT